MIGVKNGFISILKGKIYHEVIIFHCILYQKALWVQTFLNEIDKIR